MKNRRPNMIVKKMLIRVERSKVKTRIYIFLNTLHIVDSIRSRMYEITGSPLETAGIDMKLDEFVTTSGALS